MAEPNDRGPPLPGAAPGARAARPARSLVAELLADQHLRWQQGGRVSVEDYLRRHADLHSDPEGVLDLIYHEILIREAAGDAVIRRLCLPVPPPGQPAQASARGPSRVGSQPSFCLSHGPWAGRVWP